VPIDEQNNDDDFGMPNVDEAIYETLQTRTDECAQLQGELAASMVNIEEISSKRDMLLNNLTEMQQVLDATRLSLQEACVEFEAKILELQDDTIPQIQESLSNALAETVKLPGLRIQLEQKTTQISGMLAAAESRTSEIQQLRQALDNANAKMIEI
jgi:LPS O-antigen subunit length determinant protein (WzzB/FepE family)